MLDHKGFDLWADGYDESVGASDEAGTYPFAGYHKVLETLFRTVTEKQSASVLDLGFGTGTLTARLYERGHSIYGQDFSEKMLETASRKMPGAHLYPGDFARGLAAPLLAQSYDFILAAYSLHHLPDAEKYALLRMMRGLLKENGCILIGDVAFENREKLERCRRAAGGEWDDEEFYFVADEMKEAFDGISFTEISFCAGVFRLPR